MSVVASGRVENVKGIGETCVCEIFILLNFGSSLCVSLYFEQQRS